MEKNANEKTKAEFMEITERYLADTGKAVNSMTDIVLKIRAIQNFIVLPFLALAFILLIKLLLMS